MSPSIPEYNGHNNFFAWSASLLKFKKIFLENFFFSFFMLSAGKSARVFLRESITNFSKGAKSCDSRSNQVLIQNIRNNKLKI